VTWFRGAMSSEVNRIYAVTGKSRLVAAGLSLITVSQLALGIHQTLLAARSPGEPSILSGSLPLFFQSYIRPQLSPFCQFRLKVSSSVSSHATGKQRLPTL
jgi:hypothetical protein